MLRDTSGCHPHSFYTETRNPIENINRAGNFIFFSEQFQFCGKKFSTILILSILKSLLHFLKAKDIFNNSLPWKREKIKFKVLNFANSQVNFVISSISQVLSRISYKVQHLFLMPSVVRNYWFFLGIYLKQS